MAEIKSIPLGRIHVPERLRKVEEPYARAIALAITAHGLINPITVRYAPAKNGGQTPYILVAGAHRLRAFEINCTAEIEARIIDADEMEARLVEITENLIRNELSQVDKASFVISYRSKWEEIHGKITRGGDRRSKGQVGPLKSGDEPKSLLDIIANSEGASFSEHLADRMGVSPRTIKRLILVGTKLHPDVRETVRGTPDADNLTLLVKTAKMPPKEQALTARLAREQGSSFSETLRATQPRKKKDASDETAFRQWAKQWKRLTADQQARFRSMIEERPE